MIKYYSLILMLAFYSCTKLNYLGSSYTPTRNVDVFVDPSAVKKPYTIIGKGYFDYSVYSLSLTEKMQKKAIQKAKDKGADAILFQDYYVMHDGDNVRTVSRSDSIGKGLMTVKSGTIGPVVSSQRDIFFLKYN